MKKNNTKLNEGCIKIFQLILLLYQDKADYNSVVEIFKNDLKGDQSPNNIQVVLNKYINTLKVFGIKFKKENNKFKLLSSLYSLDFSIEDLKSISILLNSIENFPDKRITQDLSNFVRELCLRMSNSAKNKLDNLNYNYDFSFYYSDLKEQIEQCENICREKFNVEICYLKNKKEIKIKCTPKEILYDTKNAYIQVYDLFGNVNVEIPLSDILSITTLPQIARPIKVPTTVVYKLKNRLAKTYKLKENEYSDGFDSDGNLIVINKNEPFDKLLQRLMRYTYNCEIISPKRLRTEMLNLINKTLENYR